MPDPDLSKLEGYVAPETIKKLEGYVGAAEDKATAMRDSASQAAGHSVGASKSEELQTLKDAATMVPAGATNDWDDEIVGHLGAIGAALGHPLTDPRVTAPKGYRMARDAQRGRKAEAMDRSPWMGSAGYGLGTLGQQAVAGPLLKGVGGAVGEGLRLATGTAEAAEGANLARRVGVGVGNAAVPGAIIGAGQAENLEDVPEAAATGAAIGTAASTAARLPGGIRRMVANPAVAKTARNYEIDAALRAGGVNKGQATKLAENFPGGKEGYVEAQRALNIGTKAIPTPWNMEEQAAEASKRLRTQNEALEAQGAHLNIPMNDVAADLERKARALPYPAKRVLRDKMLREAQVLRDSGKPVYETISGRHAPERAYDPTAPIEAQVEDVSPRRGYTQVRPKPPPPEPIAPPAPPWQGPPMPMGLPENGIKRPVVTPSPRQEYAELGEGPTRIQGQVVGQGTGLAQAPVQGAELAQPPIQAQVRPLTPAQGRIQEQALPSGQGTALDQGPVQGQVGPLPPGTALATEGPIQAQSRWMGGPLGPPAPGAPPPPEPGGPLATTPGGPLARSQQQESALVAGDPWSVTQHVGNEQSFPELNRNLRGYHEDAFDSETALGARTKREAGSTINDILEKYANELPGEVGTKWRQGKRQEHTAISSRQFATAGQGGSNLGKGVRAGALVSAAGVGAANPQYAIPGLAGFLATTPGIQMRMAQGVGAMSKAAAKLPEGPLARALTRYSPSGQNLSRLAVHAQAQEGITAVQQAALQGDDAAVTKYYEEMLTNPELNRELLGDR